MALKQVIEIYELLDDSRVGGRDVVNLFKNRGIPEVVSDPVKGEKGSTDFIRMVISGSEGKLKGGPAPTLGIIGRLGGVGARPERIGLVSDADGAIAALSIGLKLADMQEKGDALKGDVLITTHVCPAAPTLPHEPVPFMGSPVDIHTMNHKEVDAAMEAILSFDTTKGNRILNHRGFAISPTVKEGWILRVSEDLLDIMTWTTGRLPVVLPITMQDITPYGNEVYHLNSILQPAVATDAPVVGVAITTEVPVPGCGTGASHVGDIESAVRFGIEAAKAFGEGKCRFFDEKEFGRLTALYGSMKHLRNLS